MFTDWMFAFRDSVRGYAGYFFSEFVNWNVGIAIT